MKVSLSEKGPSFGPKLLSLTLLLTEAPAQVIAGGGAYSIAVCEDGTCMAAGQICSIQPGYGPSIVYRGYLRYQLYPCSVLASKASGVEPLTDVIAVSAGHKHVLFLLKDSTVWGWADNKHRQSGRGDTFFEVAKPVLGPDSLPLRDIIAVSAGRYHSLFLSKDGTVWIVGGEWAKELKKVRASNGDTLRDIVAVAAGRHHSLFLKRDGTIWAIGHLYREAVKPYLSREYYYYLATQVYTSDGSELDSIIAIACGTYHALCLRRDGTVWMFDTSELRQPSDSSASPDETVKRPVHPRLNIATCVRDKNRLPFTGVVSIAGGWYHSVFLRRDSTAWAMSGNSNGQLADRTREHRDYPVQVLKADKTPLTGVVAIAAGSDHSLFVRVDGSVWSAGENMWGQLGNGVPEVGSISAAIRTDLCAACLGRIVWP